MPKTIAIDFDGVIHRYSQKWKDGTIYDIPVEGTQDALSALFDLGFQVVIYSTRCYDRIINGKVEKNQVKEMEEWLDFHGVPYTCIHTEPCKPLCVLFIDDNAYRFTGTWSDNVDSIAGLLSKH